jgi:arginine decarboxylase
MVKYMMEVRNLEIKELIVEEINHEVVDLGAVVASLVYLGD